MKNLKKFELILKEWENQAENKNIKCNDCDETYQTYHMCLGKSYQHVTIDTILL